MPFAYYKFKLNSNVSIKKVSIKKVSIIKISKNYQKVVLFKS